MAVNHILMARRDLHRNNVPWQFGSECQLARCTDRAVFGHKDRSAAGHALQNAEQTSAAGELRVCCHLDGGPHPGEFSRFRDDGLVWFKNKFQDRHGGAGDAALHCSLLDGFYVNWRTLFPASLAVHYKEEIQVQSRVFTAEVLPIAHRTAACISALCR